MQKDVILTPEGLEKLKQEIEYLSTDKRREVAERIKEAREFGDISENSEYDDAKNEQAMLEARIASLEDKLRSASVEPTIVYWSDLPEPSSLTLTSEPTRTTSLESSLASITDAERSLSSSDAMRASSIACSFFASSYSEFSEMSPNSRASLMRPATSRRFSVERYSISCLSFSSPSGVRMTSFCMSSSLGVGSGERKRPHMADEWMRLNAGAAEDGSTEVSDDRPLFGKRLGAL